MTQQSPILSIVVPCYNEEDVLPETSKRLDELLARLVEGGKISPESSVYFVDDGSRDRTWQIVQELNRTSPRFAGVKLSRNRGHQVALMTGLLAVPGDLVVSIDADLQDDIDAIEKMVAKAAEGADVVYGVRSSRTSDSMMKRWTAQSYYRILQKLSVEIVYDHADFRLLTRRAIEALREYKESNLFLRALIPLLGFQTAIVTYERAERFAGTSKYPLRKMLALAFEGITSFSTKPLRIVTFLGIATSFLALALTAWAMFAAVVFDSTLPGWASTVIPIYLISGVQLLSVGIVGEYVGKIYLETKRRPRSHIATMLKPRAAVHSSQNELTGSPLSAPRCAEAKADAQL
ncbi:glycosyltransferase family 2 protein [Microvirga sp. ACRRW]|uniref:glycosyltransferase family 2 protein n=1 Tax=Microvirga sp. ACRRW TaxID=2918205 RepID=UPI001EF669B9|nr:glycosyltransferase family 2 protein [Microvirga sp. ACRRW]MCG7392680.1 glycosyltransferase family 2 protein [Microvirga sp. ACRRW]